MQANQNMIFFIYKKNLIKGIVRGGGFGDQEGILRECIYPS